LRPIGSSRSNSPGFSRTVFPPIPLSPDVRDVAVLRVGQRAPAEARSAAVVNGLSVCAADDRSIGTCSVGAAMDAHCPP
jgi:hypothetical protein